MARKNGLTEIHLKKTLPDDLDGHQTLKFMRAVKKASGRIAGKEPGSLGLHPAIYFYSATGRFQPAAFLAAVAFVRNLEERNQFANFTTVRAEFEDFLIEHKYFINQIVRNYGSLQRAVSPILTMHKVVYQDLREARDREAIIDDLRSQSALKSSLKETTDEDRRHGRNFSTETKNSLVIKSVIASAAKCAICGGRVNLRSVSVDHIQRREDGGTGAVENGQLTHPYCNSGYKESKHASTLKLK